MKKFLGILFLCICSVFLYAEDLKGLIKQTKSPLHKEIDQQINIPWSFFPQNLPDLYLSQRLKGAVAEFKTYPKPRIYIAKSSLKQWYNRLSVKYDEEVLPSVLAQCLVPVYIHELSHFRDTRQGKRLGFVWPVTLEDEYIAVFWQLYLINLYSSSVADYFQNCKEWLPSEELLTAPSSQTRERIYAWYGQTLSADLPPGITAQGVASLEQTGEINSFGMLYRPKSRTLSLRTFLKQGGNWLYLSPKAMKQFISSPQYKGYLTLIHQRETEINTVDYSY